MDDYISRQASLDAMDTWDKFGCDPEGRLVRYDEHYVPYVRYEDMVNVIKNMPSADVQPVVRCKDCKWHRVTVIGLACDKHLIPLWTDDDDFCSRGEMKLDGRLSWTG